MEILKKIVLIILIIGGVYCIKTILYPSAPIEIGDVNKEPAQNEEVKPEETEQPNKQKEYISVYFVGQNTNKEDVYKIVKREYDIEKDGTKLEYALHILLKGPSAIESAQGIYTEIPKETKLRSISKINGKLYIDLSEDFELGGGTDGLYKRLYQLIKTVNKNSSENVYLKIEGRDVDVIGGEGLMINQPLTSHSLDG